MAQLAFLISLVALGIAILAYQEAGGSKDLSKKVESTSRDLRRETADGLAKRERPSGPPSRSSPNREARTRALRTLGAVDAESDPPDPDRRDQARATERRSFCGGIGCPTSSSQGKP